MQLQLVIFLTACISPCQRSTPIPFTSIKNDYPTCYLLIYYLNVNCNLVSAHAQPLCVYLINKHIIPLSSVGCCR